MVSLGGTGLTVSPMGFGCMGVTAFYGPSMEDGPAVELFKAAYDMGYKHFDTAEAYRQGDKTNEEQLGNFLKTVPRKSYTFATKFAPRLHEGRCDLETVEAAVDGSLARLGLQYVDVYYCHRPPPTIEQAEEWMSSLKKLVASGKARHVGLSEFGPEWIRRVHAIHPVACVQQEWSLLTRNLEDTVLPVYKELNIGVVAYSPLARNLLAGVERPAAGDWRVNTIPRYSEDNFAKNQQLVGRIASIGEAKGKNAAQLSLAWLYHQARALGVSMIVIPGTTKVANASSNIGSLDVALSEQEMKDLTELRNLVAGERGNEVYKGSALESQL